MYYPMLKHGIDQMCTRRPGTPCPFWERRGVRLGHKHWFRLGCHQKKLYREHSHSMNFSKRYNENGVLPFRLQILSAAYFAIFSFAQYIKILGCA